MNVTGGRWPTETKELGKVVRTNEFNNIQQFSYAII